MATTHAAIVHIRRRVLKLMADQPAVPAYDSPDIGDLVARIESALAGRRMA